MYPYPRSCGTCRDAGVEIAPTCLRVNELEPLATVAHNSSGTMAPSAESEARRSAASARIGEGLGFQAAGQLADLPFSDALVFIYLVAGCP